MPKWTARRINEGGNEGGLMRGLMRDTSRIFKIARKPEGQKSKARKSLRLWRGKGKISSNRR